MVIKILSIGKFWKIAPLAALVAIPLIMLGKKMAEEKGLVPESGDESGVFDWELSAD